MAPRIRRRGKKTKEQALPKPPKPKSPTLRQLGRAIPTIAEFEQIDREMTTAHDRAVALLLASQVQRYVEITAISHLVRRDEETTKTLVDRGGPLGSFNSTIRLAYALGIITANERDDLDTVRQIRNAFAHTLLPIDFKTEQIAKLIEKMWAVKGYRSGTDTTVPYPETSLAALLARYSIENDMRLKFIHACRALSFRILKGARRD